MNCNFEDVSCSLYADLLTVPYKRGGRNTSGLDCVGLFLLVMARIGVDLPEYTSEASVLDLALCDWQCVTTPGPGDGILLRSVDPAWHLGVIVGAQMMLHAKPGAGVVIERFDGPQYKQRIEGFYRWHPASAPSALSSL